MRHIERKKTAGDKVPNATIVVCDRLPTRRTIISEVIRRAGARPEDACKSRDPPCSRGRTVAVVGVLSASDGEGLAHIRQLKVNGFQIIACGEGLASWDVKVRCLPLLAGAGCLLDSATPDFDKDLLEALQQMLALECENEKEAERIKVTMREVGMIGESAAMMRVFRNILRISSLSDLPVLITGETGTGKEGLARALHRLDQKRCHGPFLPVNCSAITSSLAESEFFGHRRGAFTGADRERKGLFRAADTGVLFLDEIGDLDGALQAKLLRVLEESRVLGVGEDSEVSVSVRIIAATNRDLGKMREQGRFRADLFHRLNVLSIDVPALRERHDDLRPLVNHFLEEYRPLYHGELPKVNAEFFEALKEVKLPGNVRQLENLIRQALVRRKSNAPLGLQDLPVELLSELSASERTLELFEPGKPGPAEIVSYMVGLLETHSWNLSRSLETCERHAMEAVMRRVAGNRSKAARLLGITPRSVYNKMRKYGLGGIVPTLGFCVGGG